MTTTPAGRILDDPAPKTLDRVGSEPDASRRGFLLAGIGILLTGCAQSQRPDVSLLPSPAWDKPADPVAGPVVMHPPIRTAPVAPPAASSPPAAIRGTIARQSWAGGQPVAQLMNRMAPIRYVTIHHDGMRPFFGNDRRSAAARLEGIRRAHRQKNWGDIGYHYAVDRAGNVWECRPLGYQGAHVKNFNPGNVGIVALGNFDEQHPTEAQLTGIHQHVVSIMRAYRVPARNLRTHMQWAPTRCPGTNMQRFIETGLSNGMFG